MYRLLDPGNPVVRTESDMRSGPLVPGVILTTEDHLFRVYIKMKSEIFAHTQLWYNNDNYGC